MSHQQLVRNRQLLPRTAGVYAVQLVGAPYIKIGVCVDLWARMKRLRVGCPFEMLVVGFHDGGTAELEKSMHHELRWHRVRGEWFAAQAEVVRMVAKVLPQLDEHQARIANDDDAFAFALLRLEERQQPRKRASVAPLPHAIDACIARLGDTVHVGEVLSGLGVASVHHMLVKERLQALGYQRRSSGRKGEIWRSPTWQPYQKRKGNPVVDAVIREVLPSTTLDRCRAIIAERTGIELTAPGLYQRARKLGVQSVYAGVRGRPRTSKRHEQCTQASVADPGQASGMNKKRGPGVGETLRWPTLNQERVGWEQCATLPKQ